MLENLLSSRVRAKTLAKFFLSPGVSYHAWELSQQMSENYSGVWKELNRLEKLGILTSEQVGNAKKYRVNPACPIFSELQSIVLKTEGIGYLLQDKLQRHQIKEAYIYGSYASGDADQHSDLDLMIIGDVNLEELSSLVSEMEDSLNRPINYVIYPEEEWNEKISRGDAFAVNVQNAHKIFLVGGEDAV